MLISDHSPCYNSKMTFKAVVASAGVAGALYLGMGFTGLPLAMFSLMVFLGFGGLKTMKLFYHTGGRDAR